MDKTTKEMSLGIVVTLVLGMFILHLTGCAGANIKKKIGVDLNAILQAQDCPAACDAIKAYVVGQLGGK